MKRPLTRWIIIPLLAVAGISVSGQEAAPLIAVLGNTEATAEDAVSAARKLAAIRQETPEAALAVWRPFVSHPVAVVRYVAIEALVAYAEAPEVLTYLQGLKSNPPGKEKKWVARMLSKRGITKTVTVKPTPLDQKFLDSLQNDQATPADRLAAARRLAAVQMDVEKRLVVWKPLLEDRDNRVRQVAIATLGKVANGSAEARQALIGYIQPPVDAYEAAEVVKILTDLDPGLDVVRGLDNLMKSPPETGRVDLVRFAVCGYATKYPDECTTLATALSGWLAGGDFAQRRAGLQALAALTPNAPALEVVATELDASSERVVAGAVHKVGNNGHISEKAKRALLQVIASDQQLALRFFAAEKLVELAPGEPATVRGVLRLVRQSNLGLQELANLEQYLVANLDLADESALAVLVEALPNLPSEGAYLIIGRLAKEGDRSAQAIPEVLALFQKELGDGKSKLLAHYSRVYLTFFDRVGADRESAVFLGGLLDLRHPIYKGNRGADGFRGHLLTVLSNAGALEADQLRVAGELLSTWSMKSHNNAPYVAALRAARKVPGPLLPLATKLHAALSPMYDNSAALMTDPMAYWIVVADASVQAEVIRTLMAMGVDSLKPVEQRLREMAAQESKLAADSPLNVASAAAEALAMLDKEQ